LANRKKTYSIRSFLNCSRRMSTLDGGWLSTASKTPTCPSGLCRIWTVCAIPLRFHVFVACRFSTCSQEANRSRLLP